MAKLDVALKAARLIGPVRTWQALRYAFLKRRLDRDIRWKTSDRRPGILPGILLEACPVPNGARFSFQNAALEIRFLAADLLQVSWEPGLHPPPYALARTDWPGSPAVLRREAGECTLEGEQLSVSIDAEGELIFRHPAGPELHRELPPHRQGETLEEICWTARPIVYKGECLYGLGEAAQDRLNRCGGKFRMWNRDPGGSYGPGEDPLYLPLPVYLGLHQAGSYLIFHENTFPGTFDFQCGPSGATGTGLISFEGGMLRYYFISGPPARLLERFTELTGRPPLPPKWSLGYHQSRWGYKSEADLHEVSAGFEQRELPLSAIHLDIDYMDGYRTFTVDRERFSNLPGLSQELLDRDVHLVAIVDPGIQASPANPLFQTGLEKGLFCRLQDGRAAIGPVWSGWSAFPDFTNPAARSWWGEQYGSLLDTGIDGFWHDKNEPFVFAAFGDMTLPLSTCHTMDGHGGDHRQAHNLYGLLENQAAYEGLTRLRPDRRPWLLSRSGWVGIQRYAWNWTGDIESTWEGLRATVPILVGMGLSGLAFTGADTGGFSGDPEAELYLRWFQMATFLPFFRTHSSALTARREPWSYGEPYTSILRRYLVLRYQILPYFYTLAWEASQTGHPLLRPLFWEEPGDSRLWEVEDSFLLGSDLLIAPVLERGAQERELLLPRGDWYSLWDDSRLNGQGRVRLPAYLEQIPVLVRGGSLLPMQEGDRLVLHLYAPGSDGDFSGRLYSDAGDGFTQSSQGWRLDEFRLRKDQNHLELAWDKGGDFPLPYTSVELRLHGIRAGRAWVDGAEISVDGNILVPGPFRQILFETINHGFKPLLHQRGARRHSQ